MKVGDLLDFLVVSHAVLCGYGVMILWPSVGKRRNDGIVGVCSLSIESQDIAAVIIDKT